MYCSNCNKTFPEGMVFCDNCGNRLTPGNTTGPNTMPSQNPNPTYQSNYSTQSFTPPPYPMSPESTANNQVSTGKWIGIFLINIIPFVGPLIYLIMLFVWAFGQCKYPSLKSFSRAMLIFMLIGLIISIIVVLFFAPMITDIIENFGMDSVSDLFDY